LTAHFFKLPKLNCTMSRLLQLNPGLGTEGGHRQVAASSECCSAGIINTVQVWQLSTEDT